MHINCSAACTVAILLRCDGAEETAVALHGSAYCFPRKEPTQTISEVKLPLRLCQARPAQLSPRMEAMM